MNKKSITYVESWVNFIKLDVQCNHHLFLPLFLIASTINRLSYYFLSVYPMHLISLVKGLWCLHIALHSCGPFFPSCHKLHYHLDWGHKNPEANFLSNILQDILIETIGTEFDVRQRTPCCWTVNFRSPDNLFIT